MIAGTRHTWYTFALLATLAWLCFTFFALRRSQNFRQVYCSEKSLSVDQDHGVFENSNLAPNDSIVLTYIRRYILQPPLPLPYNLKFPTADPSRREGQNQFVLNLLKNKRNGIFIEAGANDGEYLSTTLMLERDFGWTGFLIEPDSTAFAQLQLKRRKAWLANICLSHRPQKVKFLEYNRTSTWSKIANVSEHHKKWVRTEIKEKIVQCFPLFSVLLAVGVKEIDYFSLDVEGAEYEVLKTFPFSDVRIRILSIEYDHIRLQPGVDQALRKLMADNGYRLVTEVSRGFANDYIYAHSSVP